MEKPIDSYGYRLARSLGAQKTITWPSLRQVVQEISTFLNHSTLEVSQPKCDRNSARKSSPSMAYRSVLPLRCKSIKHERVMHLTGLSFFRVVSAVSDSTTKLKWTYSLLRRPHWGRIRRVQFVNGRSSRGVKRGPTGLWPAMGRAQIRKRTTV